ncbi:hypothetical protein FGO68_gene169 [Halteria grandinella]|uniref:Uncharacterized protein n=1 Tax=Halteria grandinella TaxID=5974 RepID=A0A8J8NNH4_HALGN|nr:hypothetical protein FGO68_gene169 [Halteria grandinella]
MAFIRRACTHLTYMMLNQTTLISILIQFSKWMIKRVDNYLFPYERHQLGCLIRIVMDVTRELRTHIKTQFSTIQKAPYSKQLIALEIGEEMGCNNGDLVMTVLTASTGREIEDSNFREEVKKLLVYFPNIEDQRDLVRRLFRCLPNNIYIDKQQIGQLYLYNLSHNFLNRLSLNIPHANRLIYLCFRGNIAANDAKRMRDDCQLKTKSNLWPGWQPHPGPISARVSQDQLQQKGISLSQICQQWIEDIRNLI